MSSPFFVWFHRKKKEKRYGKRPGTRSHQPTNRERAGSWWPANEGLPIWCARETGRSFTWGESGSFFFCFCFCDLEVVAAVVVVAAVGTGPSFFNASTLEIVADLASSSSSSSSNLAVVSSSHPHSCVRRVARSSDARVEASSTRPRTSVDLVLHHHLHHQNNNDDDDDDQRKRAALAPPQIGWALAASPSSVPRGRFPVKRERWID